MRSTKSPFQTASRFVVIAAMVASCTTPADPIPIQTIQLQPGQDSISPGETYSGWIITLRDASGNTLTGRSLTWESQNTSVATVNASSGEVTGVATGTSLITVRGDGKFAQSTIKVIPPVVSVFATPDSFDVPLTTTRTINVQLVGPGGGAISGRQITFSSSDPTVATVNTAGVVTGLSLGTVTVLVTAGGKTASVRARVVAEPVTSVRILPLGSVHVIRIGQTKQFTAQCLNAAQQVLTGRTVTWNSNNPIVASVSTDGLVSATAVGNAQVSATCDNSVSTQVTAQVTLVPVTSVTISPPDLSILVNQQGQLTATARDSANNVLSLQNRSILWTSNNLPVATVGAQTGVVQGVSQGQANVQVSVDGIVSAPVTVTVSNVPVASVTIGPLNPSVTCGQQVQLTAVTRDANGNQLTGRPVTWQSANTAIATIGVNSGIATGVAAGGVQITATSEGVPGFTLLNVNPPMVGTPPAPGPCP